MLLFGGAGWPGQENRVAGYGKTISKPLTSAGVFDNQAGRGSLAQLCFLQGDLKPAAEKAQSLWSDVGEALGTQIRSYTAGERHFSCFGKRLTAATQLSWNTALVPAIPGLGVHPADILTCA